MGVRSQYLFSLVLFAVVFPSVELAGQTAISGGLTGSVTDASSAILQNANVEIKDNSKGTIHSTNTDREGIYRFFFLAPGKYTITVTRVGFASATRLVTIQVAETASADFTLKVGSANTTVDVKVDVTVLQTDKADLATNFSGVQIDDLPNPGNDLTAVVQTAPGAVMNTQKTAIGVPAVGNFASYGLP
jgi:hypothetical protein